MLDVSGLTKKYNERTIFSDLNCRVAWGQSFVVTGANGSGKSTFLRLLAGLEKPGCGCVTWSLGDRTLKKGALRKHIGYLSPELGLYERLSAKEHLIFLARVRGMQFGEVQVDKLLADVQLAEFRDDQAGRFSSGMKQRLKLACALLHSPEILILDEPFSNLDQRGKELVDSIIQAQLIKGFAVIATNDAGEVARYGQVLLSLDSAAAGAST